MRRQAKSGQGKVHIGMRLPSDVVTLLDRACKLLGCERSEFIVDAAREKVRREKLPLLELKRHQGRFTDAELDAILEARTEHLGIPVKRKLARIYERWSKQLAAKCEALERLN